MRVVVHVCSHVKVGHDALHVSGRSRDVSRRPARAKPVRDARGPGLPSKPLAPRGVASSTAHAPPTLAQNASQRRRRYSRADARADAIPVRSGPAGRTDTPSHFFTRTYTAAPIQPGESGEWGECFTLIAGEMSVCHSRVNRGQTLPRLPSLPRPSTAELGSPACGVAASLGVMSLDEPPTDDAPSHPLEPFSEPSGFRFPPRLASGFLFDGVSEIDEAIGCRGPVVGVLVGVQGVDDRPGG